MAGSSRTAQTGRAVESLRAGWAQIGGLGKLAVVGIVFALGVTLVLGFSITRSARGHLLDAREAMVSTIVRELPSFPISGEPSLAEYAEFDVAVRVNVLGGETVRVKVWAPDGTVVYSDAEELVGQRFELPEHASLAFADGSGAHVSDLSDPAHAFDRGHGELIEFYVATTVIDGTPRFVVEVEQDASGLNHALSQITRNVWLSIGVGLVAIGIVVTFGIAARDRELNRKREQAEALLQSSFNAQEDERRRAVGALHDDIGQPMYRLLYGIEGSQAKLDPDDPLAIELGHLAAVVREMDETLRNELRLLHFELAADAGLAAALEDLVDITRVETDLDIDLTIRLDFEPSAVCRTEIYRAAREAITNVRKHANAREVRINLIGDADALVLEVLDDGIGIDEGGRPGLGLSTTRQRFSTLDGDVVLEMMPTGGTRFRARLPRMEDDPT